MMSNLHDLLNKGWRFEYSPQDYVVYAVHGDRKELVCTVNASTAIILGSAEEIGERIEAILNVR